MSSNATAGHGGPGHGNSVSMWAAVGVALVGFVLMMVSVMILSWPLFWASWVVVALAIVVGVVLGRMGFGSTSVTRGNPAFADAADIDNLHVEGVQ